MSARATHGDDEARRIIREAIDDTLVVEAAAGTGKTTALVERIVRILEEGRAEVREIVAVTFTEKAAGELKLRLRRRLEEARRDAGTPEAAARLDAAVQQLEEAHVSTIHGFCAELLRSRSVEAGIDPLFRVLTEGQAARLFDEAFDAWFQAALDDPPEGVRRSLRRASRGGQTPEADADAPVDRLRRAGFELTQWRDFQGAWTRPVFDRVASIVELLDRVHDVAGRSTSPASRGAGLFADTEPVRRRGRELRRMPERPLDDEALDTLEALLVDLARDRTLKRARTGSGAVYGGGVARAELVEARDGLLRRLAEFQEQADADLAARLRGELRSCLLRYDALKTREGALDFLDLLLRARDLIRGDRAVRSHFQQRFTRIFVDEFQDTDPLQAELLLLLSARDPAVDDWRQVDPVPGKLFVVGDPKQSIYRFRRADVDVYRRVCELLVERGARPVELRRSFRSVPNIQRVVNAAFGPLMDDDPARLQARYVPLEPWREEPGGQPSVVALPVPEPYGMRRIAAREIERSLPDAVGALVDWLVTRSGWTVTERQDPAARVPLQARHVCILFRRFVSYGSDVTRPYVEALEARGVPHLLVGGRAFHDREEIEALRAALTAVEWPDDQLSVFATLRGPLFALGDEDLLEYHHRSGRFHPFRIPGDLPGGLEPVADALALLRTLHERRNRRPVAETIAALLGHTRAHVSLVLRPAGEQALANVLHVSELARQYELDGGMSFRGFVEALHEAAQGGQAAEAPVLEEGSDGVRLMTVHKAKGLEFPVVVLADITARLTPWDASRHIDLEADRCALRIGGWAPQDLIEHRAGELEQERREGERVAYVAATRARDLLVVPAVGDVEYGEGWVSPLNAAIYPPAGSRRRREPADGCPAFERQDSVLRRPDDEPATPLTVCPGRHELGSPPDAHTVVWWSPEPGALSLGAQAPFGLRRDDLIVRDVAPDVVSRGLEAHRAWASTRAAALASAARASIDLSTVTEAAAAGVTPPGRDIPVEVVSVATPGSRPGGARFGSLVHALLADAPLGAGDGALATLAEAHGRITGATVEEIEAARAVAVRAHRHPLLLAAARAAECYREAHVTLRLESGAMVEGTADLVYEDSGILVVVDFKTDRELEGALPRYEAQVRLYAAAVEAATGRTSRAVLMRI
jgi:ATP-dependent exoDNAse (exonuclease V) beta subunit